MKPKTYTPAEQRRLLRLSDERDAERNQRQRLVQWAWRNGWAACDVAHQHTGADCQNAIRDAYAAGQRTAHADQASAFDAGWAACMDRFADLIGGRMHVPHPTRAELKRWTRHSPRCRHAGGQVSCQWAGCLPGPRQDFGKPAPWDKAVSP